MSAPRLSDQQWRVLRQVHEQGRLRGSLSTGVTASSLLGRGLLRLSDRQPGEARGSWYEVTAAGCAELAAKQQRDERRRGVR